MKREKGEKRGVPWDGQLSPDSRSPATGNNKKAMEHSRRRPKERAKTGPAREQRENSYSLGQEKENQYCPSRKGYWGRKLIESSSRSRLTWASAMLQAPWLRGAAGTRGAVT